MSTLQPWRRWCERTHPLPMVHSPSCDECASDRGVHQWRVTVSRGQAGYRSYACWPGSHATGLRGAARHVANH